MISRRVCGQSRVPDVADIGGRGAALSESAGGGAVGVRGVQDVRILERNIEESE